MRAVAGLSLLAVMALCGGCDREAETSVAPADAPHSVSAPAPTATAQTLADLAPTEQKTFTQGAALSQGGNFCSNFQKAPGFENWVGRVDDFRTSTINGSIDITFDMDGIRFEQVVQKTNAIYPAIADLKVGEAVHVSGLFSHGNGECGYSLRTVSVNLTKAELLPHGLSQAEWPSRRLLSE